MFKYCNFFGIMSRRYVNVLWNPRVIGVRPRFTRPRPGRDKSMGGAALYARLMRHEGA